MKSNGDGTVVLDRGDGEVLEARGNRIVIKVATARQLVCEYTAPAHFEGPPLHVHPGFEETFMVLDGRLWLQLGEQQVELAPGTVAAVDGSVPHTFRTAGQEPVRFLLICAPGGFEDYFRGLASGDGELIAVTSERFGYRAVEPVAHADSGSTVPIGTPAG